MVERRIPVGRMVLLVCRMSGATVAGEGHDVRAIQEQLRHPDEVGHSNAITAVCLSLCDGRGHVGPTPAFRMRACGCRRDRVNERLHRRGCLADGAEDKARDSSVRVQASGKGPVGTRGRAEKLRVGPAKLGLDVGVYAIRFLVHRHIVRVRGSRAGVTWGMQRLDVVERVDGLLKIERRPWQVALTVGVSVLCRK